MKEIYIVRHGQTDYNLKGIVQGRGVDASLNSTGLKQALAFFKKFRETDFDIVYTSSLRRTQESVGDFLKNGLLHEIRPDIDEISWGIYEGLNSSPVMKKEYHAIVDSWIEGKLSNRIKEGESPIDVQNRLMPFIDELKERDYKRVLVCTHGRTMRILLCTLLEKPLTSMDQFNHANMALYKLTLNDGLFNVIIKNSKKHLEF